jgi:hypothetical protein
LNDVVNFEISEYKFQRFLDDETALVLVKVCSSGQNLHNLPFTSDTLREAAESSLRGKAIVAKYNKWTNDFQGHDKLEVPLGYFIESQDFKYVNNEDQTVSIFAYCIFWKRYASDAYEIFVNDNASKRPVSMEIKLVKMLKGWGDNPDADQIGQFRFLGVTVLGEKYTPASVGAEATMVMFEEKKEAIEKLFFEKKSIVIDNSKDSAVDGKWTNPNRKLYKPILEDSNTKSLLNEAYLIVDEDYDNNPSGALHYPHHVIRGNKLLVHISGVQSAFARAEQQGLTGQPIDHLKKHYSELGLDTEDFETKEDKNVPKIKEDFGLTINQTMEVLNSAVSEFKYGEDNWRKYWVSDFDEQFAYIYDYEDSKMFRCGYSIADNVASIDMESKVEVIRGGYEVVGEKPEGFEEDEKDVPDSKEEDYQAKCAEMAIEIESMKIQISAFEVENKRLNTFEKDMKEQQKTMVVENIISEFSSKIPKDKLDELREKGKMAENIDAFKNEVKAVAFDYIEKNDETSEIRRMGVHVNDTPSVKKFW